MKTYIFITIDTEASMGGAWDNAGLEPLSLDTCVLCKYRDGNEYGVRLLMEVLERYGLKGVFFIDSADRYLHDIQEYTGICEMILNHGHDLQLHYHPVKMSYYNLRKKGPVSNKPTNINDFLHSYSELDQIKLLEEAVKTFLDITGRKPIAFRAGCYGADKRTLSALSRNGISVDFSLNCAYMKKNCSINHYRNKAFKINKLVELPVTQLIGNRFVGRGYKPLEINAISSKEMCNALLQIHAGGQRIACIVFHSFSLLKNRNDRWANSKPDKIVMRRFKKLTKFLSENSDKFQVMRISDCVKDNDWLNYVVGGSEVWPTTTWPHLIYRYFEQFVSRL